MKYWVGVTDKNWFEFLRARAPDEVNFWQPSSGRRAVHLEPGAPFLFKLHAPDNYIVAGGFFVRYSPLPARIAWEAFGEKNGVADYSNLRARIARYRNEPVRGDPEIGCNVLNAPFFWARESWIPVPASWARNIVQGRTYDSEHGEGRELWTQVTQRLQAITSATQLDEEPRYGASYLTRARLGQGAFRVLVTEAYRRRCAITAERTLPVLEAAHIKPYAEQGPHLLQNGLLLRSDLHRLFDDGYVTLSEDMRVVVSKRIRENLENGKEYYKYDGKRVENLPDSPAERPSPDLLKWHRENRFEA